MKNSFKKAIACLLAVLMIAFSMPLSALAAVGDYEPDIQLQFSSFFDAVEETDPTLKTASSADCYESSCLAAFPIQYDAENGTLKAAKEDINTYNTYWESDTVESDWNLAEGDVFAATIRIDNVSIAASGNINIRFSDNLTPAGLYSYKSGKTTKYAFGTLPEGETEVVGFKMPVAKFSAGDKEGTSLYPGMNDTLIGDLSCIQEDPAAQPDDGWSDDMMTATLVCSGDYVDVSSVNASNGFFNIEDGTYSETNGYTYPNKFIVATFVFQITGAGPIRFALQDPKAEIDPEHNGASFFAKKSEGLATVNATTYAVNKFNTETGKNDGKTKWPGSTKMTFMGANDNRVPSYTITFVDAKGENISSTVYDQGDEIDVPALPEANYDKDFHYTYAWDTEPAATATANATYTVVETKTKHDFTEVTDPEPTCTAEGLKTLTCDCGYSYTESVAMVDHTKGSVKIENYKDATCEEAGSYDEVYYCTECKVELQRDTTVIPATGHTPAEAVTENYEAATCTQDGSYDTVVYCSVCDKQLSRIPTTIPKAHSYTSVVTPPTCEAQGYTTYTCSVCSDSYVADYTDALGHDYVAGETVAPTCEAEGYTVYTCSRCQASKNDDKVAALGHNYVAGETVAPTCEAEGYTVYTCSRCQASKNDDKVAALGHDYVAGETVAPTCEAEGYTTYTCSRCKDSYNSDKVAALGHDYVAGTPVAPTCTAEGYTTYTCSRCKDSYNGDKVAALGHNYQNVVTKATLTKNGSIVKKCSRCGANGGTTVIYYPKTITLSATSYTYDGKVKKPTVTVKGSNGKAIAASNYTVTYASGCKNVGAYTVKVAFKGNYSGTKSFTFKINPKATTVSKLTSPKTKQLKVTWKKQATQTTGYEIQIATDAKFTKNKKSYTVAKNGTTSKTITGLKAKTKYYVRIRTYKTVGKTKYYSSWSASKNLKIK